MIYTLALGEKIKNIWCSLMGLMEWNEGVSGRIPNVRIANTSLLGSKHHSYLLPVGAGTLCGKGHSGSWHQDSTDIDLPGYELP